jgi:membrane protease YdiL (CAAX protease family)
MKKTLSIFPANLLFALTMLLVLTLGSLIQTVNLSWGLIATEVFLIALPTLLFLRRQHVPLRDGLRLKPLPPLTGVLAVLLGMALYLFGLLIEGIMAQLTRMQSVPIENSMLPKTALEMAAYFAAMAIIAPLCEEILFRGAIQGAYESRKSARFAITFTAFMFAFYHFRLSGLPGLLPIAFVLSYAVWRTDSIYAGMLIHFGNNGFAAVQTLIYLVTGKGLLFINLWTMLGGMVVASVLLVAISCLHPRRPAEVPLESQQAAPARPRSWLATYWPLFVAGVLYFGVAGLTVITALLPKPAPAAEIHYGMPILRSPIENHYVIENEGGQPVGEMDCTLKPASYPLELDCTRTVRAFEYTSRQGYFKDTDHTDSLRVTWDAQTMALLTFVEEKTYSDGSVYRYTVEAGRLVTDDPAGRQELDLPQTVLVEFEWAWHASLLKANAGQSYQVPFATLMSWNETQNQSTPLVKDLLLRVGNDETLELPQGNLTVRRLTLGSQSAWYAREDALAGIPRPVKFDDGMFIYTLIK